jgi:hypothetical protein
VPVVKVFGHLVDPSRTVGLDPLLQHLSQGHYELPGGLLARHVGTTDERPQISHGQVVGALEGRLGPIPPLRRLDPGREGLGYRQDALGARLRTAFFPGTLTLEMQGRAHRWDPAAQELLGDRLLLGRQAFEHGIAMGVPRGDAPLAR